MLGISAAAIVLALVARHILRVVCAMSLAPIASESDASGCRQETAETQFMC